MDVEPEMALSAIIFYVNTLASSMVAFFLQECLPAI